MLARFTHSRLALVVTAVLATALVTGGVAWAVISPVSGGVIHGCYNPATGGLQLKVTTACPKTGNKTPINWNVQGVKGATGPAAQPAVEYVTWGGSVPANAANNMVKTKTTFGAGAIVEGISGTVTGNFSTCTGGYSIAIHLNGSFVVLVGWYFGSAGTNEVNLANNIVDTTGTISGAAQPIEMYQVLCENSSKVPIAAPAVTFHVKVKWTHSLPTRAIT